MLTPGCVALLSSFRIGTKPIKVRFQFNRHGGENVVTVSMLIKKPAKGDDPRLRNGSKDRDVMKDRTRSGEGTPQLAGPPKGKVYDAPRQIRHVDDGVAKATPRVAVAEPYLAWLGQSLRQTYEETLNEPVPESFRELLDRLEREDEGKPAE